MKRYTKTKVIRISENQLNTLQKMKSYNIDVGEFIRQAIKEKIKREYQELIPKQPKIKYPF
jgi:predicted CopG family antitoxin